MGLPSACNLRHSRAYWQNGTVPAPGTVCKVDAPPFSDITWDDVLRDMDEEAQMEEEEGDMYLELRKRHGVAYLDEALQSLDEMRRKMLRWRI
ncbi:hypothetical protein NLG97_g8174 [Lecanicillium saksenae]|uniref:Uncharacterized protein n=1 Tax=Lecanicillium saksenae TaxID=468837 RepID=A0ACC1QK98_9HYPO|nr:hypothetical protein NLG97_g8174 [Lecanicillium saksenae]